MVRNCKEEDIPKLRRVITYDLKKNIDRIFFGTEEVEDFLAESGSTVHNIYGLVDGVWDTRF